MMKLTMEQFYHSIINDNGYNHLDILNEYDESSPDYFQSCISILIQLSELHKNNNTKLVLSIPLGYTREQKIYSISELQVIEKYSTPPCIYIVEQIDLITNVKEAYIHLSTNIEFGFSVAFISMKDKECSNEEDYFNSVEVWRDDSDLLLN